MEFDCCKSKESQACHETLKGRINVQERPNILFLMSDEHRADVAGFAGNDVVRTPVLDQLAADGVVFANAYTPAPVCIPARQSIMAGQFPSTTGCKTSGQDLPPGYMTYARRLSQYGYNAVAAGKLSHHGTDQLQGWTQRICGDIKLLPKYIEGLKEDEMAKYAQPSVKWSDTKEVLRAGIGRGPSVEFDEYVVQGALNFIESYFNDPYYDRPSNQPLLLKVSLKQPHYPYFTSEEKFNYYLNRVPVYLDQAVSDHPFLSRRQVRQGIDASERELRRATAAYYGMVETIDEHYGRILEALKHVGQNLDDWIIIYTSDHGEMLGEHGVWEKQKFYEGSVKVPLIIRWPNGFSGNRIAEQNVNLCDLFATICELTGIPVPSGLDSRSLVPFLRGDKNAAWPDETISQYGGKHLMIKRGKLKYQYYEDMPEVLFDLERNPDETVNYIDDPKYAQDLAYFRKRSMELGFSIN